jgi:hypothetical protein
MTAPHAAVKHELLVRYLDAWTPAALHRTKRATYVEGDATDGEAAVAARRVFGEFADLLERQTLAVVVFGLDDGHVQAVTDRLASVGEAPAGLVVVPAVGVAALEEAVARATGGPILAWFDWSGPAAPDLEAISIVARCPSSEVLLALSGSGAPHESALHEAGLELTARVELVDRDGVAEQLVFATSSLKALERFKDELWALDEYAGIRYRDPADAEGTLLDISLQPNLGPLRRALVEHLRRAGQVTVASLRGWALRESIYRPADATRAVQTLVASGVAIRTPAGGRLSPDTLIDRSAA